MRNLCTDIKPLNSLVRNSVATNPTDLTYLLQYTEMEPHCDQIKAMLPSLINGKTHEQLEQEEERAVVNGLFHFVNGIKLPWIVQRSNLEALKTFEVRDDDVYVVTFPRSGRYVGE